VVDLRFHDVRHEAASRWLEKGWPLHKVRDKLGAWTIFVRKCSGWMRCDPVAIQTEGEPPTDRNNVVEKTPKHLIN
jgi:hypothetical protein